MRNFNFLLMISILWIAYLLKRAGVKSEKKRRDSFKVKIGLYISFDESVKNDRKEILKNHVFRVEEEAARLLKEKGVFAEGINFLNDENGSSGKKPDCGFSFVFIGKIGAFTKYETRKIRRNCVLCEDVKDSKTLHTIMSIPWRRYEYYLDYTIIFPHSNFELKNGRLSASKWIGEPLEYIINSMAEQIAGLIEVLPNKEGDEKVLINIKGGNIPHPFSFA